MKLTKKALSLLLAVLMIMTSVSVSFDSLDIELSFSAFAANGDGVQAFYEAALAHGQKYGFGKFDYSKTGSNGTNSQIKKTYTYTAKSYAEFKSYANVIALMKTAAFNLDEYTVCKTHNNNAYCGDAWEGTTQGNKCTDWVHIKNALTGYMGESKYADLQAYGIDTLLNATFNRDEIRVDTGNDSGACVPSGNGQDNGTTTSAGNLPAQMYNKIVINSPSNSDIEIVAGSSSIDAIQSSFENSYYLELGLQRGSQYKSSSCTGTSGDKYHMHLYDASGKAPTSGPAYDGSTTIDKSVLTGARTTFESTYSSYYNAADVNAVVAISSDINTLTVAREALDTAKNGVINKYGEATYKKFYDEDKVAKAIKLLDDAIQYLQFAPIVDELNRLNAIDYSGYNEAQLLEHLTAFDTQMAKYDVLDAATQELILEKFDNFDIVAIKANLAKLRHDWEVYAIRAEKVRVDTHIGMYNGYTEEMIEDGSLTSAMLTTAIGAIGGDVNKLNNYVRSTVDEVCGADYMTNLETLYRDLQRLGAIAGVNDAFLAKYAQFSDEIKNAVAEDSETLLESLQNYDTWYSELKTFIADSKEAIGEENAEMLFKDLDDAMLEYMANAYVVLQTRTENEILTAKKLLDNYRAAYGETVTMVSVSKYKAFRYAVETINRPAVEYLQASPNATISQEVLDILATIDVTFPAYEEFLASKGFSNWQTSTIPNFSREDSEEDIVRENVDLDGDGIGEYEVTDAKIQNVIDILDAALSSNAVKGIGLDIGTLLSGLVEDAILSDSFINTVVNMLYPLVLKEFGKVFANDLPTEASGQKVTYKKGLHGVFKGAGFEIYPDLLATELGKSPRKAAYADTISRLNAAYTEAKNKYPNVGATNDDAYSTVLDPAGGTGASGNPKVILDKTAWDSDALYDVVLDDEGNPVIDEATGEVKKVFALTWGIDAAKEAGMSGDELKELFYQTFDDAVEGLKPLLCALIANETWFAEQDGLASALSGMINVGLELGATANSGYANLIVPIFETLGVSYTSVDTIEKTYTTYSDDVAAILKAILEPIFGLVDTIGDKPLNTVLGILPNLCFALSAQMVPSLLSMLKTSITYLAPVSCGAVESPSGGVDIDVGTMLKIDDLIDLSDGLNSVLRQFGLNIPAIDQGYIATLGTMTEIDTQRKAWIYTKPASGKAKYIEANKADVLLYLIDYALGSDLLSMFMEIPAEGFLGELFAKLAVAETRNDVLAALVELLNGDGKYKDLANYTWYEGVADGTAVGTLTDPAVQIYLDTNNDWTEAKANYLYENIDAIVAAVIKTAGIDLNDLLNKDEAVEGEEATTPDAPETVAEGEEGTEVTEEEVAATVADLLGALLGGVLSAETLTTIAGLLGSISDLDALLAKDEAVEGEEATEPEAPETVAEEGEEVAEEEKEPLVKIELNINNLIKDLLGIDLKASYGKYAEINAELEADPTYVYDFGKEIKTTADFVAVLTEMLAPISGVLGFILDGKDLEINLTSKKIKLNGYNGYDSAIVPVLEALGCDVKAHGGNDGLALTLNALAGKIDSLLEANTIKGIIDILPGLFYFLAGNNLATVVSNLLQPVYVILDTIRPVYDLDLDELLAGIEINGAPLNLDLRRLNLNFVFELVASLLPADLDLGTLLDDVKGLIYSICKCVGVEYTSVSKLAGQKTWKRGALTAEGFSGGDLITVLLSYVLDWALVEDNAATLDALLGTEGLIANIGVVFADVKISYNTPEWGNWLENDYTLETTKLNYNANDWDADTAEYFAGNLSTLADTVVSMIEIDGVKYDNLSTLLTALIEGNTGDIFTAETINNLIGMISGVLANVDDTLLNLGYELLGLDLVGLKNYVCAEDKVTNLDTFVAELAGILDTYAKPLVDLLFFGDDIRLALDADATPDEDGKYPDQIVINGGLGYEWGIAIILEALGCEAPAVTLETEAPVATVLGALVDRINEIIADPVNEIIDMLPNLIFVLNANGIGVAIENILKPVFVIIDKINALEVMDPINLSLADLIKIKNDDGEEIALDLTKLSLSNVTEVAGKLTGLDLSTVADILDTFKLGSVEKTGEGRYKIVNAKRDEIITVILIVACKLINDDTFANSIDGMIGKDILKAVRDIFNPAEPEYNAVAKYDYTGIAGILGEVVNANLSYPESGDWTEEKAEWLVKNLPGIVDAVISMIEIEGVKYENLQALVADLLKPEAIFSTATLDSLVAAIATLLEKVDENLLEAAGMLLKVDIVGLKKYDAEARNNEYETGIDTVDEFAAELANVLTTYAKGLVEFIFLGRDYKFIAEEGEIEGTPVSYVTIQGTNGYAEGLAPILEALGCEELPAFYGTTATTEKLVADVFASLANRINAIIADPVNEVIALLPSLIYFLNSNGLAVAVDNLTAGIMGLINKLEAFGLELDINELVNLQEIIGTTADISLDNLTLAAVIDVAADLTGLNLDAVKSIFVDYALGEVVEKTNTVSTTSKYTMQFNDEKDAADMLTAVIVAVLITAFDTEGNDKVLEEMIGSDIIGAIEMVINDAPVSYSNPNWYYCADENGNAAGGSIPVIDMALTYPNDWTEERVETLANALPGLVDAVIAMINKNTEVDEEGNAIDNGKPKTLAALLADVLADANIFTTETLESLVGLLQDFLVNIDDQLLEAGMLLNVDIVGLKKYNAEARNNEYETGIDTVDEFAKELAYILTTYADGIIDWLLLGEDYNFFVKAGAEKGAIEDYITINGAHGYAMGLALILEALGCEDLPKVDTAEGAGADTAKIVEGVLASVAALINKIIANPVEEVLNLLPNLIYFLNTNGVAVAVDNTVAALEALLLKLKVFDITNDAGEALTLADLVDLKDLLKLPADAIISINNLTLEAIIDAASKLTGLDLTVLNDVLAKFALGELKAYTSASGETAYKMVYVDKFDKGDMITVLLTSVLLTVFETEGNTDVLADMLGTDIVTAIEDIFNDIAVEYAPIDWGYASKDSTNLEAVKQQIANPNNWTNEEAAELMDSLPNAADQIVRALVKDPNIQTLSKYLDKLLTEANIFSADTLNSVVGLIANLVKDIDDELLKAAGIIMDIDVVGLKNYKAPADVDTVEEFAAELAYVLTEYANDLVEWLLLGNDFRFFVKDTKPSDLKGELDHIDFITINGAHGYAEGLALILEALGCENLPAVEGNTTEDIVAGVLASLAARINAIIADPVNEVIDLLPNLLYFINANGFGAAIQNTVSAIDALLAKLADLGVDLSIEKIVDLKKLLNTDVEISLYNITMANLLELAGEKINAMFEDNAGKLNLTVLEDILVGFALGQLKEYDSVSANKAYKMVYRTGVLDKNNVMIDRGGMLTVIANAAVMLLNDPANFDFLFGLLGNDVMLVIMNLFHFESLDVQEFDWAFVEDGKFDANEIHSAFETSQYKNEAVFGEFYTKEQAQYIADNFDEFVTNVIVLLGLDVDGNGKNDADLTEIINGLINGGLYNSANVVAIQDLVGGILSKIGELEVKGIKVGPFIKIILKHSLNIDIDGIAAVEVPEFTDNRAMFVEYLCAVLEPVASLLEFVLANKSFSFFTAQATVQVEGMDTPDDASDDKYEYLFDENGDPVLTDAVTLKGAEGYAFGIIPLLELLECEGILTPDEYYAPFKDQRAATAEELLGSILNPLLNRLDEIIANPADEILEMLPNLVYFVNSNGVDTVVKNTLNAVFSLLSAIEDVAKIDIYALIGVDFATIDFDWIVDKLIGPDGIITGMGYTFTVQDISAINELTVGKLVEYKSLNGKTAYKMVYAPEGSAVGGKAEMITVVERLIIKFLANETNQKMVVKFLVEKLGMGESGKEFAEGTIEVIAKAIADTSIGTQVALAAIYYIFYGVDIGVGETLGGITDFNKIWSEAIGSFKDNVPGGSELLDKLFGLEGMDDVATPDGVAQNGLVAFFARIADFFAKIGDFFKNLFSFNFLKK